MLTITAAFAQLERSLKIQRPMAGLQTLKTSFVWLLVLSWFLAYLAARLPGGAIAVAGQS